MARPVIKIKGRSFLDVDGVREAVAQSSLKRLEKAALLIRVSAVQSMVRRGPKGTPSPPGTPPHPQSRVLKNSIQHARTETGSWVIGPTTVASYGRIHEFGGRRHPPRPFMRPALLRVANQLPSVFSRLQLSRTKAGLALNRLRLSRLRLR